MQSALDSASSSEWRSFIDNFPDHIARFDRNFKHLYINRAIEKEIQMPAAAVIGKSNRQLRIPDSDKALDALENKIGYVFQTGLPSIFYTRHTFPEGTRYYYMKLIPSFLAGTAQVESVWAITREITTLKQFEKKLRQSRKMLLRKNQQLDQANANLDTFFYTVSHDLRTPLANIKAIVSLLQNVEQEQVQAMVGLLDQSTQRLDNILDELTELIQFNNNKEIAGSWEFNTVLSTVKAEFSTQLTQIGGDIEADFSASPSVSYVKPYLESLFRNMISNAIRYRHPNRALLQTITTRRENDYVLITFQDNGLGIDLASNAHKLFKPFYQVNHSQEGKGMGLHIIKSILEKNGGKIEVSSELNQGTAFMAYIKEY